MHFEENQLSRNLISLSPLTTSHPNSFQPIWVRSSTKSYLRFNLLMVSSFRFGSTTCNYSPYKDSVSLRLHLRRLNLATHRNSATHNARGTWSGFTIALPLLVSKWFQILFHSPYRGSFHLSLTVLVRYRSVRSILPWRVVPPDSDKVSRAPSYSGYSTSSSGFKYGAITLSGVLSQTLLLPSVPLFESYNPEQQAIRFGLFHVRSPLLAESQLITLPSGT